MDEVGLSLSIRDARPALALDSRSEYWQLLASATSISGVAHVHLKPSRHHLISSTLWSTPHSALPCSALLYSPVTLQPAVVAVPSGDSIRRAHSLKCDASRSSFNITTAAPQISSASLSKHGAAQPIHFSEAPVN
ncbi:hypothetical protein Trco_000891 [Trichoderma cornu-damae]|uniref:Uncharacterized protein n=1 Tax=Trichoderma cornu-damae TaxID=654480 RepID=A0A9P8QR64_9HYPO|nr:hypothetical protein Trco_000891 [Trichoderma cornu-damae]